MGLRAHYPHAPRIAGPASVRRQPARLCRVHARIRSTRSIARGRKNSPRPLADARGRRADHRLDQHQAAGDARPRPRRDEPPHPRGLGGIQAARSARRGGRLLPLRRLRAPKLYRPQPRRAGRHWSGTAEPSPTRLAQGGGRG